MLGACSDPREAASSPPSRPRLIEQPDSVESTVSQQGGRSDGGSECGTEDSLWLSEDSEGLCASPRPPLAPGTAFPPPLASPIDGRWTLCGCSGARPGWADSLVIQGSYVETGDGGQGQLLYGAHGPMLFDGLLLRRGGALVRKSRSGDVQVFLRSQ